MKKVSLLFFVVLMVLMMAIPVSASILDYNAEENSVVLKPLAEGSIESASGSGSISRAEWLHQLVVAFDMTVEEDNYPDNYYSDLTSEHEYYKDIMVAVEFGVVDLPAGEALKPDDPSNREFAAHTLNFCLGYQLDEDAKYTFEEAETVTYPDDIQVAIDRNWFALINGKFEPEKSISSDETIVMLSDTAEILKSTVVDENHENTFEFNEGVIEIPQDTVVELDADGAVHIISSPKEIKAGDTFVVYLSELPSAYTAKTVTVSEDETIITVEEKTLDDVAKSADAEGVVEADLAQAVPMNGSEIIYIFEDDTETDSRAKAISGTKHVKTIYIPTTIDLGGGKLKFTCKLSGLTVDYKVKKGEVFVAVNGLATTTSSMSIDLEDIRKPISQDIAYINIGAIGYFKVTAHVDVKGTITFSCSNLFTAGVHYTSGGGFRLVKSFTRQSFSLCAEASVQAGISAALGFAFPGVDGNIYVSVGAKSRLYIKERNAGPPDRCTHLSAYLYAEVGAKVKIYSVTFGDGFPIYDDSNSPVRLVRHYEDGKLVPSCTFGDCGSYYSPWGSAYGGGYGLNAYGIGYNANWEPITIFNYTLNDAEQATITGYYGNVSTLMIPQTLDGYEVIAIGNNAFKNNKLLSVITIPEGITSIGSSAFSGCTGLTDISFPESLTSIGSSAFYNCTGLTEIILPKNQNIKVSESAFRNCTNLQKVFIPKNMSSACIFTSSGAWGPFAGCKSLNTVEFEEGITRISTRLFAGCTGLREITIPNTVTVINDYAFSDCPVLEKVTLSDSLTSIGSSAFYNCTGLTDISFPESLTSIGSSAFYNCTGLTEITLPDNLNSIGSDAFQNCKSLTSAKYSSRLTSIPQYTFSGCESLKMFVVPEGVTSIGSNAFYGCKALEELTLPNGLKTIGSNAFYNNDVLKKVAIPNSVTALGTYSFAYCDALGEVTFGTGLTEIPNYAFYQCRALEKIALPYRLTTIGSNAFANCTGLIGVTIPCAVTSIDSTAFSYTDRMTIYGVAGTTAETFAGEQGFKFEAIDVPATEITLSKTELTLNKGSSAQLSVSITPSDFTDATAWKSANTSVATVSDAGLVKAVGVGETTINFVAGNVKSSCKVTVVQPVTSISLNKTSVNLDGGDTYQLTATAYPTTALNREISWSSSAPEIAGVSENGLVTALKKGTATITAKAKDGSGVTKQCTVTVLSNLHVVTTPAEMESSHPYAVNTNEKWQYTKEGASMLEVTFSDKTSVEEGTDYIYIYDKNGTQIGKYTGTELAGKTVSVSGDTVVIKLTSDDTYCEYGFAVTDIRETTDPASLVGLEMASLPKKIVYTHDEALSLDGGEVKATYGNGESKVLSLESSMVSGFDGKTAGKQTITVTYEGKTTSFEITVNHSHQTKTVAPTCTEPGYTLHFCSCGDNYKTDETAALNHSYQSIVIAPTCTEKGYTTHTCTRCENSYKDNETNALGHTEVADKAVDATCTATGLTAGKHCSVCNEVLEKQEVVAAKGHTEVADKAVAATCTETGLTAGKHCSVCNEVLVKQEVVAAKGHTEVIDKAVAATCTKDGLTEGKHCSVCNEVLEKQEVVKALGHSWDGGEVTKKATTTETGVKTYTCTRCKAAYTETIAKLPITIVFDDVTSGTDWFAPYVNDLVSQGILNGKGTRADGTPYFEPLGLITRGEFSKILATASGDDLAAYNGYSKLSDTAGHWALPYINWAYEKGIVTGFPDGTFAPDASITREQMAAMICRYASYKGVDLRMVNSKLSFKDDQSIGNWAKINVYAMQQAGIINGYNENGGCYFKPRGNATRAEAATMIDRFLNL